MRKLLLLTALVLLLALPAAAYDDVPEDFWALEAIGEMTDAHVTTGYPDNTFRPGETVSRAQFTAMLLRACSDETIPLAGDGEAWWQPYLDAAADAGLLADGAGGAVFDPAADAMTAAVTRCEAAVLLDNAGRIWNGLSLTPGWETDGRFSDEIPVRYAAGVESAAALGLLSGYPDGTFGGDRSLTRAEACVLISRLMAQADLLGAGQFQAACTGDVLIRLTLADDGAAVLESVSLADGSQIQRLSVPMDNYVGVGSQRRDDPEGWAATYGRTALAADGEAFWGEIGYYTYNEYGRFTQWTDRAVLARAAAGDDTIVAVTHRSGRRPYCPDGDGVLPAGDQVVRIARDGTERVLLSDCPDGLYLTGIASENGRLLVEAAEPAGDTIAQRTYLLEDGSLTPAEPGPSDE